MSRNIGNLQSDDESFRYKMPKLIIKVETIKTLLLNIDAVAKALYTNPEYICKYIGFSLGTISSYDKKRNIGVINGSQENKKLQELIDEYTKHILICPKCVLPELFLKGEKKYIDRSCDACSYSDKLNVSKDKTVDKIINYIIKNPSDSSKPRK